MKILGGGGGGGGGGGILSVALTDNWIVYA